MKSYLRTHRRLIGLTAAAATAIQCSWGLGFQLILACTNGTEGLSLGLFAWSFIGMTLWALWAATKPEGPELIVALPNTLGAIISLAVCAVIVTDHLGVNIRSNAMAMPPAQTSSLMARQLTAK